MISSSMPHLTRQACRLIRKGSMQNFLHLKFGKVSLVCSALPSTRYHSTIGDITINSSSSKKPSGELDQEKELFGMKRELSALYAKGNYEAALVVAVDLLEKSESLYGRKNAIYASCLSNIALMQKSMGDYDLAMNRYTEALHVYQDVQGKQSPSYAATLSNLGTLYRMKAMSTKGLEKQELLARANEAYSDSLATRRQLLGTQHKDTITSLILLAGLKKIQGDIAIATEELQSVKHTVLAVYGSNDLLLATIENNLGLIYKEQQEYTQALECYRHAIAIRSNNLWTGHPEVIIAQHNLAECLLAMGNEQEAYEVQQSILAVTNANNMVTADLNDEQSPPPSEVKLDTNKTQEKAAATTNNAADCSPREGKGSSQGAPEAKVRPILPGTTRPVSRKKKQS